MINFLTSYTNFSEILHARLPPMMMTYLNNFFTKNITKQIVKNKSRIDTGGSNPGPIVKVH